MSEIAVSNHGVVAAPNRAAAETGRSILIEGGDAYEAMVGMAATLAVTAPQAAALGGDAVWLVREPTGVVRRLEACGPAGAGATLASYHRLGHDAVPLRGALSALTVPGAVDGWRLALEISASVGGRLPREVLFADAIRHARDGFAISRAPDWSSLKDLHELTTAPGFADAYLVEGKPRAEGDLLTQRKLADTLDYLARSGLADFYRGDIAREMADDLDRLGAPLGRGDLRTMEARLTRPLSVRIRGGAVHGAGPQALETLVALGALERLGLKTDRDVAFVHGVAEAAKRGRAALRDAAADPDGFDYDPATLLTVEALEREKAAVDPRRAAPFADHGRRGEASLWMGVVDVEGRAISCAQSLGSAFGSGCVLPATGVLMGNRGAGFSLDPDAPHALAPGRRPPHGPNPALAAMTDGRVVVFGGPPETQATLFVRHVGFGLAVDGALAQPAFRLGRSAARDDAPLALGSGFDDELAERLERLGHRVVALDGDIGAAPAGAIVRSAAGRIEGGFERDSDGCALGL